MKYRLWQFATDKCFEDAWPRWFWRLLFKITNGGAFDGEPHDEVPF